MASFRNIFLSFLAIPLLACTGGGWDGGPPRAGDPVFNRVPGTYLATQTVSLSSKTPEAEIRFTTDGSTPTDNTGTVYTTPLLISGTTIVTAVAFKGELAPSHPMAGTYTVLGIRSFKSGANHTVFLCTDNTVWSVGGNRYGQRGNGTLSTTNYTPFMIPGLRDVVAIGAGDDSTFALKRDGTVWAIGNNSNGQLGDGTTTRRESAVQVRGLSGVRAITAAHFQIYAITNDNTLWAWGKNSDGLLGDGTTTDRLAPVLVPGLTDVSMVSSSPFHAVALKNDGTAWSWGSNGSGELGDGTRNSSSIPVQVSGLAGAAAVFTEVWTSGALMSDNTVTTWGRAYLAPGDPGYYNVSPKVAPGLSNLSAIVFGGTTYTIICGGTDAFAVGSGGTLLQRNTGSANYSWAVFPAMSGAPVLDIARGYNIPGRDQFFTALSTDGRLWGWGANDFGQLGPGEAVFKTPTLIQF